MKWGEPISQDILEALYCERKLSAQEIADRLSVSYHKVAYWMDRYGLKRRDRHQASYQKHNPAGDKFSLDCSDRDLFVAGVALYLGEGDKTNPSLIVTNSDPRVLQLWVRFLDVVCGVRPEQLKAHIDYYADLEYRALLQFWSEALRIPAANFEWPTLKAGRPVRPEASGRRSRHGTVHVKFHDAKLKALMLDWMTEVLAAGS